MNQELPYTKSIIEATKARVLELISKIPLEPNYTTDYGLGENCFRLKCLETIKKEIK